MWEPNNICVTRPAGAAMQFADTKQKQSRRRTSGNPLSVGQDQSGRSDENLLSPSTEITVIEIISTSKLTGSKTTCSGE